MSVGLKKYVVVRISNGLNLQTQIISTSLDISLRLAIFFIRLGMMHACI